VVDEEEDNDIHHPCSRHRDNIRKGGAQVEEEGNNKENHRDDRVEYETVGEYA
jgi:hypothetical protein